MARHGSRQRLQDILDAIGAIRDYTVGKNFDVYNAEPMLRDAVERNIERISEASRHLPDDLKNDHPTIPWHEIAAIGNILRHAYGSVEESEVWTVVTDDLDPLEAAVDEMVRKIETQQDG